MRGGECESQRLLLDLVHDLVYIARGGVMRWPYA